MLSCQIPHRLFFLLVPLLSLYLTVLKADDNSLSKCCDVKIPAASSPDNKCSITITLPPGMAYVALNSHHQDIIAYSSPDTEHDGYICIEAQEDTATLQVDVEQLNNVLSNFIAGFYDSDFNELHEAIPDYPVAFTSPSLGSPPLVSATNQATAIQLGNNENEERIRELAQQLQQAISQGNWQSRFIILPVLAGAPCGHAGGGGNNPIPPIVSVNVRDYDPVKGLKRFHDAAKKRMNWYVPFFKSILSPIAYFPQFLGAAVYLLIIPGTHALAIILSNTLLDFGTVTVDVSSNEVYQTLQFETSNFTRIPTNDEITSLTGQFAALEGSDGTSYDPAEVAIFRWGLDGLQFITLVLMMKYSFYILAPIQGVFVLVAYACHRAKGCCRTP